MALSKKKEFNKAIDNAKNIEIFASELEGKNKEEFVEKLKSYGFSEGQATALFKTANTDGDDIISKKESLDFTNLSETKKNGVFNADDLKFLLNAAEEAINFINTNTDNLSDNLEYKTTGAIKIPPVNIETGEGNTKAFGQKTLREERDKTAKKGAVTSDTPSNTSEAAKKPSKDIDGTQREKSARETYNLYPRKQNTEASDSEKNSRAANKTASADKSNTPSTQSNNDDNRTNGAKGNSTSEANGTSKPGTSALEEFGISPTTISDALNNPTNDPAGTGFPGNASGLGGNYYGYPGGGGYPSTAQGYGGAAGNGGNSGGFWDKVANGLSSLGTKAPMLTNTISSFQGSFMAGMSPSMQTYFMGQAMQNMSNMFSGLFGA
ncbi:MAG: hypothetical protein ACI4CY_03150, partial [Candidatus Gastranaerophilaceae bacterium]